MKISAVSFFLAFLILATSCAGLRIAPPGPDKQTLLVLPAKFSNPTHNKSYGFKYVYEIVSDPDEKVTIDTRVIPYEAVFKLPVKGGMLIVDVLPPGKYIINKLVIQHYGTGTSSTYRKTRSANVKFKLEYGKISILPKTLNITLSYEDPGRIETIIYRHRMVSVSSTQRGEILTTLKNLENFDKWELWDNASLNPTNSSSPDDEASFFKGVTAYESDDYVAALKELKPLATKGHAQAQNYLGVMYFKGYGVTKDVQVAFKWFNRAAEQGHANDQFLLGFMYNHGQGVTQDYEAAFNWYKLAAEQGHAKAQYKLGGMYSLGQGIAQDYIRAHMWLNIAASNGDEDAKTRLNIIETTIGPEKAEEARELARECVRKKYKDC